MLFLMMRFDVLNLTDNQFYLVFLLNGFNVTVYNVITCSSNL